jgi:hypothetical protein
MAYSLPAGHRLRVAVSPTYWPWAWPSPEPVRLTLFAGTLELPARPLRPADDALTSYGEPEQSAPLETETIAEGEGGRYVNRDLGSGLVEQVFDYDLGGTVRLVAADLESSDTSHTVYSIREGDPLSAEVRFHATSGMARGDWGALTDVTSSMTSDTEAFHVTTVLEVFENGEKIFARAWEHHFPRDGV